MEIGISTASFFNKMLNEDAVTDIGRHGVKLCEAFLNTFSEYTPAFADLMKERADAHGITYYSVHPQSPQFEPQLFSIHPRQRADALEIYDRVLTAGETLGARVYVMHGAATLNGAVKNMELARIAPIFVELTERAATHGLTLALESVSWCICCTPDFVTALREATGDRMHFTLDIKQCVRAGYDPLRFLDAMGDRLVNVHLCDVERTPEGRWRWRMPGEGTYDFAGLFERLADMGYQGPAFVEVYSDMYTDMAELYGARDWLLGQLPRGNH